MNSAARAKRTKFREERVYASHEEFVQMKLDLARKHLEGVDLSFLNERKKPE